MWGDLGFDRGTEIVADASELPGENQMEFPFRHGGKQHAVLCFCSVGSFHGFCRTWAIANLTHLLLAV